MTSAPDFVAQSSELELPKTLADHALQQLRARILGSEALTVLTDPVGVISWLSPQCDRVLGQNAEALVGTELTALIHPDHADAFRRSWWEESAAAGTPREVRARDREGSPRWLAHQALRILEAGQCVALHHTLRDLTERKQLEGELEGAEWKFRAIFEQGPIAVAYHRMVYDAAGTPVDYLFLEANQQYLNLTGVDPRGKLVTVAFPGIERDPGFDWIGTFGRVARTGETVRFEQHLQVNDRWYDCVGYQYRPDHFVAAFIEITERKRLEARQLETQLQLAHSRKMDAIGQLAGGIAHDFNNMLTGIMGAADVLDTIRAGDPVAREMTSTILLAAERAAQLTSKLLAFGRKTPLQLAPVAVDRILDDAVTLLTRTIDKACDINVVREAKNTTVQADPSLLQNIFLNLGVNAAHAMPDGGRLTISTRNVELDESYCSASRFDLTPGAYLEVEVRDTGCGIAPENLPRVFEPFFTTKEQGKGTGLGLAAVYGSVLDLHGSVSVYSEVGVGTAFTLHLPLCSEVEAPATGSASIIPGSGCVLVIDDEEFIRRTAQAMLERMGYSVIVAENGAVGVECFAAHRSEVRLVLLDLIMPVLSGRETFKRLREIDPTVTVVVSSGFSKDSELSELRAQGVAGFLRKPYRLSELSQVLAEVRA